jgi:very-short-patch-repair endonuclease
MTARPLSPTFKRARELRSRMPLPEVMLWNVLRNKQLGGLRFRRQQPIGPFFIDFFCCSCGLAIELDGESHNTPEALQADERRDRFLAAEGARVIRFLNSEVRTNLDGVLHEIFRAATGQEWNGVLSERMKPPSALRP